MMYLLSRTCWTPSMRTSRRRTQSAFSSGKRDRRANQRRLALEHHRDFPQVIGCQRRAGRDQVADQVGTAEARRDLDGARQRDDFGFQRILAQERARATDG